MNGFLFYAAFQSSRILQLRSVHDYTISSDASELNVTVSHPIGGRVDPISILSKMTMFLDDLDLRDQNNNMNGAAFHFTDPGWRQPTVLMRRSTVVSCVTTQLGGGGYMNGGYLFNAEGSSFQNVSSLKGGALYIQRVPIVELTQTNFKEGNSTSGGALYIDLFGNSTIFDCIFESCQSTTNGGAIAFYRTVLSGCHIRNSMFVNCSSVSGGAIYVNINNYGDFIFNRVCAYNCMVKSSTSRGQFLFVEGNNNDNTITLKHISATKCSQNYLGIGVIYFSSAYQDMDSMNFSENTNYQGGAVYNYIPYGYSLKYSTLVKNSASNDYLLYTHGPTTTSGTFLNIIIANNTVPTTKSIIYIQNYNNKLNIVQYSIFLSNSGILLSVNGAHYILVIKNSYIQHSGTLTTNYQPSFELVLTKSSLTETFILTHYSTFYCLTPEGLSQQGEEPCQTLPPVPTKCQTQANPPTSCYIEPSSESSLISVTTLFRIIQVSLALSSYLF